MNTLYFFKSTVSDADQLGLASALQNFWNTTVAVGQGAFRLSDTYNENALRLTNPLGIKMYNMSDPTPRVAIFEEDYAMQAGGGPSLPFEVALCLSFRGTPASGVPAARRRGRIYLGPFNTTVLSGVAEPLGDARPAALTRNGIMAIGARLGVQAEAAGWDWVVHSPATGIDARFVIQEVSCDNAFDTQRRRGLTPTIKEWITV